MANSLRLRPLLTLVGAAACLAQTPQKVEPRALFPEITAVVNGASFQPGIVSGSWATIIGTDLASTTRSWTDLDFANGNLPPNLSSTGVVIGGKAGFVSYVSPTQVNVLVPDDAALGQVTILVTTAFNSSNIVFASKVAFAPALFTLTAKYPVAAHNSDGSYSGPVNVVPGISTTPARPNEVIQLFGTGFGPTNPARPAGMLFVTPAPLAQPVTAMVGGVAAKVDGYLIYNGVYQLNLTVPDLPDGEASLILTIGSNSTQAGLSLSIAK